MSIVVDMEKDLGAFHLGVKFEAGPGTLALLGVSGCGKSMTLKCIAGIERPDRGRIVVDGVTLFDAEKKIDLPPQKRGAGLLFQNYALFPNMTVEQNICAGARWEPDKKARRRAAADLMARFGLLDLAEHYPHQLSGGQQQRTALARILVSKPRILLLDEPFSALDSHLRFRMEGEVRQVIQEFGGTVLLVSHDRDEVFRMADRIAVMENGSIQTMGDKGTVFAAPRTVSAAALTGCKNLSPAAKLDEDHIKALDWGVTLRTVPPLEGVTAVGLRMHDVRLGPGEVNSFRCRVAEEIEKPFSWTLMLLPLGTECTVPIGCEVEKEVWQARRAAEVEVHIPPEAILRLKD